MKLKTNFPSDPPETSISFTSIGLGLQAVIVNKDEMTGHMLSEEEEAQLLTTLVKRQREKFTTAHSHAVGELVERVDELNEAVLKTQFWQTSHSRENLFIGTSYGPAAKAYKQAWDAVTQALGTTVEDS